MPNSQKVRHSLSSAQSGMWFAQQLDPLNPIYNTGEYVEINGNINQEIFELAVRKVVMEAEALHVRFEEDEIGPWQVIEELQFHMHFIDVRKEENPEEAAKVWMKNDLSMPVDLKKDTLFTEVLIQVENNRFFWYQRIHHIVMDGYGFSLLSQKVAKEYTSLIEETNKNEKPFGSLAKIVQEDMEYRESKQFQEDRAFWLEKYGDEPEVVSLAERAPRTSNGFLRETAYLCSSSTKTLLEDINVSLASWPEFIIAVTSVYIHKLTGANDIVLGLPMMGRLGSASIHTPSMVMNLVPLRLTVTPNITLAELLQQVSKEIQDVRRHHKYRHEELRRDLKLLGENQRLFGPLVNVMPFDYGLNFAGNRGITHNLSAGPVDDLSINVYKRFDQNELMIHFDANPEVYSATELALHKERFMNLLELVVNTYQKDEPIGKINITLPEENHKALLEWNETKEAEELISLPILFEKQVQKNPNKIAVTCNGVNLTYKELNERANELAHYLVKEGIRPNQFVALVFPRSVEMVVSMLAVLKAGAAYLPIDPEYPAERIHYIVNDAKPACIITHSSITSTLFIENDMKKLN